MAEPQAASWVHKGFALLLIIFCMEIGVFLMLYPWTDHRDTKYGKILCVWHCCAASG